MKKLIDDRCQYNSWACKHHSKINFEKKKFKQFEKNLMNKLEKKIFDARKFERKNIKKNIVKKVEKKNNI